jgi:integrase
MKISHFFEREYVPTYQTNSATIKSYRISINKLVKLFDDPTIYEVNLYGSEFVKRLSETNLKLSTINKHCRELNAVFMKLGPPCPKNRDAKGLLDYYPYFAPPEFELKDPPEFSDEEFQLLFNAFNNETEYPQHLPVEKRPLFWQAIMIFVSILAVRREAVLGIEWRDINKKEMYVKIRSEIDKKEKTRFKPIQPLLIEYLEQIRPVHITWNSQNKIFEWSHCDTIWYECWRKAENSAGIKMGLHDIKRFSGELALRAGADVLLLQAHMDHANIKTTLNHYCRPKTRNLVNKIVVPIPNTNQEPEPPTPPTDEKFQHIKIAPAFHFDNVEEFNCFCKKELYRIENAVKKKLPILQTANGTVLSIYNPEEKEMSNDNINKTTNTTGNGNNAG